MNTAEYRRRLQERSDRPLDAGEFRLWEIFYPENLTMRRHSHDLPFFSFVLEGGYVERHGRRARERSAGDFIVHTAQESHAVDFRDCLTRIFQVDLSQGWIEQNDRLAPAFDEPLEVRGGPLAWIATRLFREFERNDQFSALSIQGLILEMIAGVGRKQHKSRRESPKPKWLGTVEEMLRERFAEKIPLEEIAAEAGVHPVHLSREFRKHNGQTIGEFIRMVRIDSACRKLAETELDLASIGTHAGFYDQSHFTSNFKRLTGVTPGEYREILRSR
ncbi:MAG: helix-turn-helix domain-containing protein [Acidobacteriota bacterium]|nr:MAG: helix-turn-helix domain-containing protein [Acidobacteriota bacterium]